MLSHHALAVTQAQALAWRLDRHLLAPLGCGSAADVVRRLGAVLSSDSALAELATGTRQRSPRPGDLAQSLADGEVINVFAYRGALHYMSTEDAGTYLALRAAGRQWERPSWVEHYGLAPDDWPDFRAAVRDALKNGPVQFDELAESVTARRAYRHLRPGFDDGASTLLKPLTWHGDLGFGPPSDGRRTFVCPADNPRWGGIPDLEEAGPRAIRAYVATYGPATTEHVHHWLGTGLSAGTRRLDRWLDGLLHDTEELVTVDVDGATAHVLTEDADSLAGARASEVVRLLPGHDPWVMGAGTKDAAISPPDLRQAITRKANLVLVGGVVRATWMVRREPRTTGSDEVVVTWPRSSPVPRAPVAAIEDEVRRLALLLGEGLQVSVVS